MAFGAIMRLKVVLGLENKDYQSGLNKSQASTKRFASGVKSQFGALAKTMAATFSVVAVTRFAKAAVAAAGVQEAAEKKLADQLKQTGEYTDANFQKLKNYASAIQSVSTVGDEVVLSLMQIGSSMGIASDQLDLAAKNAIGLSKAYKVDLNAAMKMVATAMKGDYNLMNRYIPQIRGVKDETEKAAIANKAMADGWRLAQGEIETFPGKVAQLKNSYGDLLEKVGEGITKNASFNESLDQMKQLFSDPAFQQGIADVAAALASTLGVMVKMLAAIPQLVGGLKELNVVEDQQMGAAARSAEQTALLQKRLHGFLTEIKAGKDVRHQMLEDFAHIEDKAAKYNAIMLAIKQGKYGDEMAAQFKKWYAEQKEVIKETEKQITQEPKIKTAIENTSKAIGGKTDALKKEADAAKKDKDAMAAFEKSLSSMPKVAGDYADIAWELGKDAIPTLTTETIDLTKATENVGKEVGQATDDWSDMERTLFNVEATFNNIVGVLDKLGLKIPGLSEAASTVKSIAAGLKQGDFLGYFNAALGFINLVPTVVEVLGKALKLVFNTGLSQAQIARRALDTIGDSALLGADKIRELADAMKAAGITEWGDEARKFADEWLRANGLMEDFIALSKEARQEWVESGGRGRGRGVEPGEDPFFGRDLPGTRVPGDLPPGSTPPPGVRAPTVHAASGYASTVLRQDTPFIAHTGERVQIDSAGSGGQVASIHIHNERGGYTSRDFVRDLRIGRYNREISDALRVPK